MATLFIPFLQPPAIKSSVINHVHHAPLMSSPKLNYALSKAHLLRVQSNNLGSFLHLKLESKIGSFDNDLSWFHPLAVLALMIDFIRLKFKFGNCVSNGVRFHKAKFWEVTHGKFKPSIIYDDGSEIKASLIVDASGFASTFIKYDKPRNHGYQIAHGIIVEVDLHPFDLENKGLFGERKQWLMN